MESIPDSLNRNRTFPGPGPSGRTHDQNKTLYDIQQMTGQAQKRHSEWIGCPKHLCYSQKARLEFPEVSGHCLPLAILERAAFLAVQEAQTPHAIQCPSLSNHRAYLMDSPWPLC